MSRKSPAGDSQKVFQRKGSANDGLAEAKPAMNPLFDARDEIGTAPALHAFIIGVSDYANLSGKGDPLRERHWGMKKLESAALSAYRVHEWLLSRRNKLAAPLATSRVLLSPSGLELAQSRNSRRRRGQAGKILKGP